MQRKTVDEGLHRIDDRSAPQNKRRLRGQHTFGPASFDQLDGSASVVPRNELLAALERLGCSSVDGYGLEQLCCFLHRFLLEPAYFAAGPEEADEPFCLRAEDRRVAHGGDHYLELVALC